MKVAYKGRRNYGCSLVEIDYKDSERDLIEKLAGIMERKGWKHFSFHHDLGFNFATCPTVDSREFREDFMPDWKEAKLELERRMSA